MQLHSWRRVLLALLGIYILAALAVLLAQRRLIYLPTRFSEGVAIQAAKPEGFEPWRNSAGELIGWHLPCREVSIGSVIITHGNAGCALSRGYLAKPIHEAAPLDVFVLEYPGYGSRAGAPSMANILAAADEAMERLPTNLPVYVVAESLGTGPAAHLARRHPTRVAGMALFVPYDQLASVAQYQMPWLPASLLLRDRYDPSDWLKDFRRPILFVVAENDTVIPAKFGKRLHDNYAGPRRLRSVANAGHNDVAGQSPDWWRDAISFWRDTAAPGTQP